MFAAYPLGAVVGRAPFNTSMRLGGASLFGVGSGAGGGWGASTVGERGLPLGVAVRSTPVNTSMRFGGASQLGVGSGAGGTSGVFGAVNNTFAPAHTQAGGGGTLGFLGTFARNIGAWWSSGTGAPHAVREGSNNGTSGGDVHTHTHTHTHTFVPKDKGSFLFSVCCS